MKLVSKFFGGLLILAITAASLVFVVDSTLLDADYLNAKAGEVKLYQSLSQELPAIVVRSAVSEDEAKALLADVLTPEFLESKIGSFLDGLEAYYKEGAPAPSLDLTLLADQLSIYGIQVPPDSPLAKPIKYEDPAGFNQTITRIQDFKTWSIVAVLGLLAAMWVLNRGWSKYTALAKTFVAAAFVQGFLFLLTYGLPQVTQILMSSVGGAGDSLTPLVLNFSRVVGADMGQVFLKVAAGLLTAAAGMIALGFIAKLADRAAQKSHKEPVQKPVRPKLHKE